MSSIGDSAPAVKKRQSLMSIVNRYQKPSRWRSIWQLTNSILLYFALLVVMYFTLSISYWLTLGISVIAAGFLVRLFIIFHDCGHGSFFKSRRVNWLWGLAMGIITYTPYSLWHRKHAIHHETSGDLDRRGVGDVWTMTTSEYLAASRSDRRRYAFYRNPFVLLVLGPLQILLIQNRMTPKDGTSSDRKSVIIGNLAIVAILAIAWATIGLKAFVLIQLPVYWIGAAMGIWLFYVQHQFEGVYWDRPPEWNHIAASLEGSSFYKLPKVVQWFTGNIGFHHIHHLSSMIPNYYLQKCHEELEQIRPTQQVKFFKSLKALNYRLWDEDRGQMISFRQLKVERAQS